MQPNPLRHALFALAAMICFVLASGTADAQAITRRARQANRPRQRTPADPDYGVGTFGDDNASVTVGGGYGFGGGEIEAKPVGMIGGELRIAPRVAIVTENYLLPITESNFLYSFGLRFMSQKITTDLALVNVSGGRIIGVPYVDFVFQF